MPKNLPSHGSRDYVAIESRTKQRAFFVRAATRAHVFLLHPRASVWLMTDGVAHSGMSAAQLIEIVDACRAGRELLPPAMSLGQELEVNTTPSPPPPTPRRRGKTVHRI